MATQQDPQLVVQKIFENVRAGGNITVGNITQIYQFVSNLGNFSQSTGFPHNIPPVTQISLSDEEKKEMSLLI